MSALSAYSKYQRLATIAQKLGAVKCEAKWLTKAFTVWAKHFKSSFDFFGDTRKVDQSLVKKSSEKITTVLTGYFDDDYDRTSAEVLVVGKKGNTQSLIKSGKSQNVGWKHSELYSDKQGSLTLFQDKEIIKNKTLLLFRVTFPDGTQSGCYLRISETSKRYRVRPLSKNASAFFVAGNLELYNHNEGLISANEFGFICNGFSFTDLNQEESQPEEGDSN